MRYSAWPFWLKVALGVFESVLVSVLFFFWWPKRDSRHRWLLLAGAIYLLSFWLLMRM